jgi:hypothetical protein
MAGVAWFTDDAWAFMLMMMSAAFAASLLVLYFEWRRRLRGQVRADGV